MKRTLSFLLVMLCMLPAFAQDLEQIIYNKPNRLVNDYVAALSQEEQQSLEKKLDSFDHKTSTQIAIVVINELKGRKLEETATRLFNAWGIGQRDKNNGLLILAVMQERKVRIEVGRGLEGAIPNETAARIIQEDIVPAFKEAKYFDGFSKAAGSLMKLAAQAFPDTAMAAGGNGHMGPTIEHRSYSATAAPVQYTAEGYEVAKNWNWPDVNWGLMLMMIFLVLILVMVVRKIFTGNRGGVFGSNGYKPVIATGGPFLGGFQAGWFFSNMFHKHPANAAMFYLYKENQCLAHNNSSIQSKSLASWSTGGKVNNSNSSGSVTFGGGSSAGGGASGSW